MPGSLQLHTGFARCLCCSETLPVPSAALQKGTQDQVLEAEEVSEAQSRTFSGPGLRHVLHLAVSGRLSLANF